MAFKASLLTGKSLTNLIDQVKDLAKHKVEVGHFKAQGEHPSGYTYAQLMALHHNGSNPESTRPLPPRPILDILFFRERKLDSATITSLIQKYKSVPISPQANKQFLEDIGKYLREKEKDIFGSNALVPNTSSTVSQKGKNSPMIDTGELRSKTAYRTSYDGVIKEG